MSKDAQLEQLVAKSEEETFYAKFIHWATEIYGRFVFWITLWWMNWNNHFMSGYIPPGKKIIVIGDGIAQGYGDSVLPFQVPGITQGLEYYLSLMNVKTSQWSIYNCGEFNSNSLLWQPENNSKLLNKVMQKHSDAKIVLIHLGTNDVGVISPEDTLIHIKRIAAEFTKKNILVFVSLVLSPPTRDKDQRLEPKDKEIYTTLNNFINNWLESEENTMIRKGTELNSFEYHWRSNVYCSEYFANLAGGPKRYYLNWRGYTQAAGEWKDILQPTLVKMEFE